MWALAVGQGPHPRCSWVGARKSVGTEAAERALLDVARVADACNESAEELKVAPYPSSPKIRDFWLQTFQNDSSQGVFGVCKGSANADKKNHI